MVFLPKELNIGWDHLMHPIGVGIKSLQSLFTEGRQGSEWERNKKTKTFFWKWGMVW